MLYILMIHLSFVILHEDRQTIIVVLGMLMSSPGVLVFLEDCPYSFGHYKFFNFCWGSTNRHYFYWRIEVFPRFPLRLDWLSMPVIVTTNNNNKSWILKGNKSEIWLAILEVTGIKGNTCTRWGFPKMNLFAYCSKKMKNQSRTSYLIAKYWKAWDKT